MGYSITIEVPTAATDANRILGVNRFAKHALFKSIKDSIILKTAGKRPGEPLENFKITIVRHGSRALDYDNLIGSFKPFIDALKLSSIIKDDSWKYIKHITTDQVISKEKKLVITVEEA